MEDRHSSKKIKLGVFLLPVTRWLVMRERLRLVEKLGFERIWVGDKFAAPGDP